ncbi:imidazole glycerol phosphate synthase, glutamine amidotransferase subunit, partial [gut metagenome]
MIGIIDYGMGNLHSVYSACQYLQLDAIISSDPKQLEACERLILPGVGAFGDMDHMLRSSGLYDWIIEQVQTFHKPLLGICLGMQALFDRSFEFGQYEGLHFMKGDICPLESLQVHEKGKEVLLTVPQIGWNKLFFSRDFALA